MTRCVIVRPGETDYDREGRITGTLDLPMNEAGEQSLNSIVAEVATLRPDIILASPQDPARSTAQAIGGKLDIKVRELDDLVNIDQGLWEGRLVADIRERQPKLYRQWADSPECVTPPEGESCGEAAERVRAALKKPLKKYATIVVVAAEPLATLVHSVVAEEAQPRIGKPQTSVDDVVHVEVVSQGDESSG